MNELIRILMERDGLSKDEAIEQFQDMRQEILDGEDPEEVLYNVGLEPDYIFDLI